MRFLLLLLLAGCATIDVDNPPPSDWPNLRVEIIHTSTDGAKSACHSSLDIVYACSVANFATGVCNIYTSTDSEYVIDHEKMHCKGYDHGTDNKMRAGWERYKREANKRL